MKVNAIFRSIQGESTFAGLPCTFVRLTGCNLRCTYCDTTYAYEDGRDMAVGEVLGLIRELGSKLVEITGGEPMLQEAEVVELTDHLVREAYQVLIETNGSRDIGKLAPEVTRIVDVKCPDSGMMDKTRWENLEKLRPTDQLKFVLSSRRDYEWAKNLVKERGLMDRATILFSPAFGLLEPKRLALWLCEDKLPIRLQLQLHKYIWGPGERGV